jgi:hypothetical protein
VVWLETMLDDRAKRNKQRMIDETLASGSTLPSIFGVGPILPTARAAATTTASSPRARHHAKHDAR